MSSALRALALVMVLVTPVTANSWLCADSSAKEEITRLKAEVIALREQNRELSTALGRVTQERESTEMRLSLSERAQRLRLKMLERENKLIRSSLAAHNAGPRESWTDVVKRHRNDGDIVLGLAPVVNAIQAAGGPRKAYIRYDKTMIKTLRRQIETLAQVDGWVASALEAPVPEEDVEGFSQRTASLSSYADDLAERIASKLGRLSPPSITPRRFRSDDAFRTDGNRGSLHRLDAEDIQVDDE